MLSKIALIFFSSANHVRKEPSALEQKTFKEYCSEIKLKEYNKTAVTKNLNANSDIDLEDFDVISVDECLNLWDSYHKEQITIFLFDKLFTRIEIDDVSLYKDDYRINSRLELSNYYKHWKSLKGTDRDLKAFLEELGTFYVTYNNSLFVEC